MGRKFFCLLIALCLTMYSFAQLTDSVTVAEGQVINSETKQPVVARITYTSLPYGNRIGVINGDHYSFPMFDDERYSIEVRAAGYATAKYLLDPSEGNSENRLIKDIELTVGSDPVPTPGQVMLLSNLIFEVGRARISEESFPELDIVVNMMQENQNMVIQLEGHTDYQGSAKENMKLSKQRVSAVKDYLVSKGIAKKRIATKAFGGTMPLSKDNTPEAHRMNRRVELRILEN